MQKAVDRGNNTMRKVYQLTVCHYAQDSGDSMQGDDNETQASSSSQLSIDY